MTRDELIDTRRARGRRKPARGAARDSDSRDRRPREAGDVLADARTAAASDRRHAGDGFCLAGDWTDTGPAGHDRKRRPQRPSRCAAAISQQ